MAVVSLTEMVSFRGNWGSVKQSPSPSARWLLCDITRRKCRCIALHMKFVCRALTDIAYILVLSGFDSRWTTLKLHGSSSWRSTPPAMSTCVESFITETTEPHRRFTPSPSILYRHTTFFKKTDPILKVTYIVSYWR